MVAADLNGDGKPDLAVGVTSYGYFTPSNHEITTEVNPLGRTAAAQYDAFGRLSAETPFDGSSTTAVSGAEEQLLVPSGGSGLLPTVSSYQGSFTDPNGHSTTLGFDDMGHVTSFTDALGATTTYTRDGRPTAVADPLGRTTQYQYDLWNDVVQITRPDNGVETIAYDAAGNLTSTTDALGRVTSFAYDARNRLTAGSETGTRLVFRGAERTGRRATGEKGDAGELVSGGRVRLSCPQPGKQPRRRLRRR